MTSRAEYRLLLRHDNADQRLRKYGYYANTITEEQYERLNKKLNAIEKLKDDFNNIKIKLDIINSFLDDESKVSESMSLTALIKRPLIDTSLLLKMLEKSNINIDIDYDDPDEIFEEVEIDLKYDGYIRKAMNQAEKMKNYDNKEIPANINYDDIDNIALEAREKFKKVNPRTIGQASRISGVNPADISVLVVYIERLRRETNGI